MYLYKQSVMFQHCDPAGIVFYPRYFEMLNAATECWFDERLGCSFARLHGPMQAAVPTARFEIEFERPSRLGDVLEIALRLTRVGRSSSGLSFEAQAGGETRLSAASVLVHVGQPKGRPRPWPDDLRQALLRELEEDADA